MNWNEFEESNKEYPEKIIETMIAGFKRATKNLADLILEQPLAPIYSANPHLDKDFVFDLYLMSSHIRGYRFNVLSIGYGVELAPIFMALEESIFEDIYKRRMTFREQILLKNENELREIVQRVFECERFRDVTTGVMKIARKNSDPNN